MRQFNGLKIDLLFGEKVAAYNFPYSKLVEDVYAYIAENAPFY